MDRRKFLAAGSTLPAAAALGVHGPAQAQHKPFAPTPGRWRTFEVVTRVELAPGPGAADAWVPLPSVDDAWQQTLGHAWSGNATRVNVASDRRYGATMVHAHFDAAVGAPVVEVTSRFRAQDRATNAAGSFDLHLLGDALAARDIHTAVLDSFRLCRVL